MLSWSLGARRKHAQPSAQRQRESRIDDALSVAWSGKSLLPSSAELEVRLHLAQIARAGPSGRNTTCSRHARTPATAPHPWYSGEGRRHASVARNAFARRQTNRALPR